LKRYSKKLEILPPFCQATMTPGPAKTTAKAVEIRSAAGQPKTPFFAQLVVTIITISWSLVTSIATLFAENFIATKRLVQSTLVSQLQSLNEERKVLARPTLRAELVGMQYKIGRPDQIWYRYKASQDVTNHAATYFTIIKSWLLQRLKPQPAKVEYEEQLSDADDNDGTWWERPTPVPPASPTTTNGASVGEKAAPKKTTTDVMQLLLNVPRQIIPASLY
jgi:hypothetical protein